MNRRGFIGALVGGVAVAAVARTWPFRVYSFPSQPKLWIHPGAFDFGYDMGDDIPYLHRAVAAFNYGSVPLFVDTKCRPGTVYRVNLDRPIGEQFKVAHPSTVNELLCGIRMTKLTGVEM